MIVVISLGEVMIVTGEGRNLMKVSAVKVIGLLEVVLLSVYVAVTC